MVLSSGGYGPATISQPVVITAIGVDASISVTAPGANGLTISTTGNVTLIGLNLHGEATGANGIQVNEVTFLRLYNMYIENFTNAGLEFNFDARLAVYNSTFANNHFEGVQLQQGIGHVEGSAFDNNGHGVEIDAGQLTVADSIANMNFGGFIAFGGTLTLYNDRATFSNIGLSATGGTVYFANCFIANNVTAYHVASGFTMAGTSPGTSFIAPGQMTFGTLSPPIALQ